MYESLVESNMTSESVSNLLELLENAIEYYSARSDPVFKVYLTKLQELMSNEMTQVIINSKHEQKKREGSRQGDYMSIIDMF